MAKFLQGKLVGIKEDEYEGRKQYIAQLLEEYKGSVRVEDIRLADGELDRVKLLMDKPVTLSFAQRFGAKNGRAWLMMFGGRLVRSAS
jgi:hypothetical protein